MLPDPSSIADDLRVVVSGLYLLSKAREPGALRCGPFVAASITHANGSVRELAVTEHENVGNFLECGVAHSRSPSQTTAFHSFGVAVRPWKT